MYAFFFIEPIENPFTKNYGYWWVTWFLFPTLFLISIYFHFNSNKPEIMPIYLLSAICLFGQLYSIYTFYKCRKIHFELLAEHGDHYIEFKKKVSYNGNGSYLRFFERNNRKFEEEVNIRKSNSKTL